MRNRACAVAVALGDNCEGEGSKADPTVSKSPVHEPLWHTSQPSIAISAQMLFICFDAQCGPPFGSSAVRSTSIAIRTMASTYYNAHQSKRS
jgi:hypothetical protein